MKFDQKSMGIKLWRYFILLAAVILTSLWLMQIVFLQSFYVSMKTRAVERAADTLSAAYGQADFATTLDKTAFANSILVFVTDTQGNTLYTSDEHAAFKQGAPRVDHGNFFRPLPFNYNYFLDQLNQSASGRVLYTVGPQDFAGKSLVCGVRLPDAVLYISTPLEAVNATTGILRTQLVYITIAALLLSFVIAFFFSRKFSQPVRSITNEAEKLAQGDFDVAFDKGFCTELDELSETLDHTAKELSKVETLRRELIANISHDLRTPLTMIRAYTEMIHDISGDNKEKREAHLAVIAGETERLTRLVSDILALSAIQTGNQPLQLENLDLSDAVKRVLSRFEPIFAREGCVFQTSIEPDQYVHADAAQMEQVLYNLIGNALNYIGEDKVLAVNVKNRNGRVRVEIADHGEGIPEEEIPLIWERYYKAKTHARSTSGTGLGLSIVKGILEAHGAQFGVESTVGAGSVFWFELNK